MTPSILVTGAGGQIGRALDGLISSARHADRAALDVTDRRAVEEAVDGTDVVVHLAAWTDVDGCERDEARCWEVNARGTMNIADAAAKHGAKMIYLSTDYVFDGSKRGEYLEDDVPAPLSSYGRAKLAGERAVLGEERNLIVRTSWVFGDGRNFVRTVVDRARSGGLLKVIDDQRGRPSSAASVAGVIAASIPMDVRGIVHTAGDGDVVSWADLAEAALDAAQVRAEVERVDSETYAALVGRTTAPRPANSALSLELARSIGLPLRAWRGDLDAYVAAL